MSCFKHLFKFAFWSVRGNGILNPEFMKLVCQPACIPSMSFSPIIIKHINWVYFVLENQSLHYLSRSERLIHQIWCMIWHWIYLSRLPRSCDLFLFFSYKPFPSSNQSQHGEILQPVADNQESQINGSCPQQICISEKCFMF